MTAVEFDRVSIVFGDDPDKAIIFHCSNLPKSIFVEEGDVKSAGGLIRADDIPVMDFQEIIAGTVGGNVTIHQSDL